MAGRAGRGGACSRDPRGAPQWAPDFVRVSVCDAFPSLSYGARDWSYLRADIPILESARLDLSCTSLYTGGRRDLSGGDGESRRRPPRVGEN